VGHNSVAVNTGLPVSSFV